MKNRVGYIVEYDLKMNPHLKGRFRFREESFTRRIGPRSDKVYSKLFQRPVDYEEIESNARIMKNNPKLVLVREPFLLDDELREKVVSWVKWANEADPSEYDPFAAAAAEE